MVGMPYPNSNSPELKEKMEYLNANFVSIFHFWYAMNRESYITLPGDGVTLLFSFCVQVGIS
jgi:Rad3-related DNA helicase